MEFLHWDAVVVVVSSAAAVAAAHNLSDTQGDARH